VPGDAAELRAENARLREPAGRLRMLVEDKDAKIAERAARAVAAANTAIRALIILARVVCGGETPLRAGPGPKSRKKYLQVACTTLLTYYFPGARDLLSFKNFVCSDLHGTVVVHDRYACYDAFDGISHQLCTQHLLRDLEDAAQTYPDAVWPAQIAGALRDLIHQANRAPGFAPLLLPGRTVSVLLPTGRDPQHRAELRELPYRKPTPQGVYLPALQEVRGLLCAVKICR
jgi:hypothetical protein